MRAGMWHQLGYNTHRLAIDVLNKKGGVGVIIPETDIRYQNAQKLVPDLLKAKADILFDTQFYVPEFSNARTNSYPAAGHRASITSLNRLTPKEEDKVVKQLEEVNKKLSCTAILAPAVVYQASRRDLQALNRRLHDAARRVAEKLNLPLYATLAIGNSLVTSKSALEDVMGFATSLDADGWYLTFEFREDRIPSSSKSLALLSDTLMTLALTGKPTLHAFAGPMALLSMGLGATAVGVGPFQTLWQFDPSRYGPRDSQGGGGDAPQRFFSSALWGTIVFPDELIELESELLNEVYTPSPFADNLVVEGRVNPARLFKKGDACRHLVWIIANTLKSHFDGVSAKNRANKAIEILSRAVEIHSQLSGSGLHLKDKTDVYQAPWLNRLKSNLQDRNDDYRFLDLIQ